MNPTDPKEKQKQPASSMFHPSLIRDLAEEVAKTLIKRLPTMRQKKIKKKPSAKKQPIQNAIFLDTSAIIDGRIFSIIKLHLFTGTFIVLESVLFELKHIADSQNTVKRERGRRGLESLDKIKKEKRIKVVVLNHEEQKDKKQEVDEQLLTYAKRYKGKVITCDYNLEKKASISGIIAINMNALAQCLKVSAVPGESLHVQILHSGKDPTQGVAYLDDGTMIVVERAGEEIGNVCDIVVSRVIQTASGKIFFAKKI